MILGQSANCSPNSSHTTLQPDSYVAAWEDSSYPGSVINSGTGDFIVAEAGGGLLGLIHVEQATTPPSPSIKPRKYAVIVDFMVKEQHRRRRIGHMLLEGAREWTQARSFYQGENFHTVSRTLRLGP